MTKNFDKFPVNIAETAGRIARNPFIFHYERYEVWQGGKCIFSGNSNSKITTRLEQNSLHVIIEDESISKYINKTFHFGEISTNNDRIMWSKDIFNTSDDIEYNTPDVSSLFYINGELSKVTFTIHNPNTLVEFYRDESISTNSEPDIITKSKKVISLYEMENITDARPILVDIYRSVKHNPAQLKEVNDFESLGKSFMLMLDQRLSDDIDTLQMMSSLAYLFISKAIKKNENNPNLIKDRLIVLRIGHDALKYTVMSALRLNEGGFMAFSLGNSDLKARDAIYKMEIADLELNPILYLRIDFFNERKVEFDEKIRNQFFMPEKTKESVIESGIKIHNELFDYLDNMVILNEDVDF
ncbi:hypothetical protein MC378_06670 [Polaribacter sp. MSW13]|uniref:Uncharacterized protein n=1 Tax=Polaribacter marinus TaxID=2916838 RepID=A0A9X1VMH0_9FLAO|nr:hypothetical protein [Polaribacter marinus]MCI2228846.1 hypothetical protein [Polaribacter marinus]